MASVDWRGSPNIRTNTCRGFISVGTGLVGAGFVLLLYFLVVIAWKVGAFHSEALAAVVRFMDQSLLFLFAALPLAPPSSLQVGMFLALVGVVLGSIGVLVVQRQAEQVPVRSP